MLNPLQTKLQIDSTANIVTINSDENIDFSIYTLDLNKGEIDNLSLTIIYISPIDKLEANTFFKLTDYFHGNGAPLVLNNNPIYVRTIKKSDIKLIFKSVIKNDNFDLNISYIFN